MPVKKSRLNVRGPRADKDTKWSKWQQPVEKPDQYLMFCCDCSLAHKFEFRVGKGPGGKPRAQFRVCRADLYTQMMRKKKGEKGHTISILKKNERIRALVDGVMVISLVNGLRRGGTKRVPKKRKSNG